MNEPASTENNGGLSRSPFTALERIPTLMYASSQDASKAVAREIAGLIRSRAKAQKHTVLGFATGSTPTSMYDELIRLGKDEGLSFKSVITFNLDEYYPMRAEALQSYNLFMWEHLFSHVDIERKNVHIPDGTVPRDKVAEFCQRYEQAIRDAGGIDLQVLGIGRTGHIGFNEPGSPRDSRTRLITLDKVTRMDAASDFFGEWNVPRKALTMGVDSILCSKRVVLMAWGEHKSAIIKQAVEADVSASVAASYLQQHANALIVLDSAAAADLTRYKTPWLLGNIEEFGLKWDARLTRKASTWLAHTVKKPVLKLPEEDYNEHGLQDLLSARGGAYDINIEVFRSLQDTITGWPGGKPVQPTRKGSAGAFPKRVVVFSPHPDDDVISMGGTLIRLCEQGHDVHVAYQTSGNIAVWDAAAVRHTDFVVEFTHMFKIGAEAVKRIERHVEDFVRAKKPGEVDSPELQQIKSAIRRSEARAAAQYSGVKEESIHFLEMPFYETGRVRKKPLSEEDIRIIVDLLEKVQPHQIYAAGDLSDPHGTHRVCLAAVFQAMDRLRDRAWLKQCEVWLYRGAWQEWPLEEISMAVPLSPDELLRKRLAIFKHESQKDRALFPGPYDTREFWQRSEDRNRGTARLYDKLGLAEYEAIEGFVRCRHGRHTSKDARDREGGTE